MNWEELKKIHELTMEITNDISKRLALKLDKEMRESIQMEKGMHKKEENLNTSREPMDDPNEPELHKWMKHNQEPKEKYNIKPGEKIVAWLQTGYADGFWRCRKEMAEGEIYLKRVEIQSNEKSLADELEELANDCVKYKCDIASSGIELLRKAAKELRK